MSEQMAFLTKIHNSYHQHTLTSWEKFMKYVSLESRQNELIWRGQKDPAWLLESTLTRLKKKLGIPLDHSFNFRQSHLENFKYSARGRRGVNPVQYEKENEWWALGQHYGLATPLLDWTHSPFVAAYFAFCEEDDNLDYRVVYALYKPTLKIM